MGANVFIYVIAVLTFLILLHPNYNHMLFLCVVSFLVVDEYIKGNANNYSPDVIAVRCTELFMLPYNVI